MLIARAFGKSISCCSRSPRLATLKERDSILKYQQRFTKTDSAIKNRGGLNQTSTKKDSNGAANTAEAETSTKEAEAEALSFLAERGKALGTPLTLTERKLILKEAGFLKNDGTYDSSKLRQSDWEKLVSRYNFSNQERLTLNDFIAKSHDGFLGQKLLQYVARCGSAFFALTGAHIAGESGMHVFGSVLVGCVTALGGRTINDLFIGNAPVTWVKKPSFLILTSVSGLVGFYIWPLLEEMYAVERKGGRDNGKERPKQQLSDEGLDDDAEKGQSGLIYTFESIALGALCVVGAQQGIVRSLHPLISATLGVTIAFGGVFRDLLCRRDLSLGAATGCQSYGIASFSGAAVYVALRELHVWNCAGSTSKLLHGGIPIGFRIVCGFGTAVTVRTMAWWNKPDGLLLPMEDSVLANKKRWEKFCEGWR